VAAPAYLARHGRPSHPRDLERHACFGYAYLPTPDIWRFTNRAGEEVSVRPSGPLRANNAEAMMPALLAGLGIAEQPDFIVREALADGRLEAVLTDWSLPLGGLYLLTPSGGPRPARIEALVDFLTQRLRRGPETR
jgi:DNA-binding transcriptional LysR family regulator